MVFAKKSKESCNKMLSCRCKSQPLITDPIWFVENLEWNLPMKKIILENRFRFVDREQCLLLERCRYDWDNVYDSRQYYDKVVLYMRFLTCRMKISTRASMESTLSTRRKASKLRGPTAKSILLTKSTGSPLVLTWKHGFNVGTAIAHEDLFNLVVLTAQQPDMAPLFNYSSSAWNNAFFFMGIVSPQKLN